ncbi:MAG: sigma-54 dependent transcriptional regulator [Spirochaetaceae bacterium]|nr:sigma-54 dependent transcriptional regulator [Spirochaetaceae bacterium]
MVTVIQPADPTQFFDDMIGACKPIKRVYRRIDRVAQLEVPVLVTGESGTGKELVAQSIHRRSNRSSGPFLAVNTGAISRDLIASELFGHERGAFTGAEDRKKGFFERAAGGTLFLDEITTMDSKTQISLLRVLEAKELRRVGGRELIRTDVRVIAATNQDLQKSIQNGTFREDLYHRLNVFNIKLPPLRKRKDDIPVLVSHFAKVYADKFGKKVLEIDPEAMTLLTTYSWPGNVRELENVIANSMVMVQTGTLMSVHLPSDFRNPSVSRGKMTLEMGLTLEEVERRYITETMKSLNGNKTLAADSLGISRKTLYNKLNKTGES